MNKEKYKILVTDDVEAITRVYARFLESEGYEVEQANNGFEALKTYQDFKPDLIISDIRMPKMDGYEFAQEAKRINPDQKVILMTGYADEIEILEKQEDTGFPFFTKPADLRTTVSHIVKEVLKEVHAKTENLSGESTTNININESIDKSILASLTHGLKNEFSLIETVIDDINILFNDDQLKEHCSIISHSIDYCQVILKKYLYYLDIGKITLCKKNVYHVSNRIYNLAIRNIQKNIAFETNISHAVKNTFFEIHLELFMGVVLELINNSNKELVEHGGFIRLNVNKSNKQVKFSVLDNGPGIPTEIKDRIFKSQLSYTNGLGYGLLFSKTIIEAMNGYIEFKSSNKGTRFDIILPIIK